MRRKNTTSEMMKGYLVDSLFWWMKKKPFHDITIGEIAKKAGVNRSTYYRHFYSKEDIIAFGFERMMKEYLEAVTAMGNISHETYLYEMFSHFYRHKEELLLMNRHGVAHLILGVLNRIFLAKASSSDFSDQFPLWYHTGGIYHVFLLWFSFDMEISPRIMTDLAVKMFPADYRSILLREKPVKAQD